MPTVAAAQQVATWVPSGILAWALLALLCVNAVVVFHFSRRAFDRFERLEATVASIAGACERLTIRQSEKISVEQYGVGTEKIFVSIRALEQRVARAELVLELKGLMPAREKE